MLFGLIAPEEWRNTDDDTDYEIQQMRNLLIEFVGGEPGEQLRDQFASDELDPAA